MLARQRRPRLAVTDTAMRADKLAYPAQQLVAQLALAALTGHTTPNSSLHVPSRGLDAIGRAARPPIADPQAADEDPE